MLNLIATIDQIINAINEINENQRKLRQTSSRHRVSADMDST